MTERRKVSCPHCERSFASHTGLDFHLYEAHYDQVSDLHWLENAFYINEAKKEEKEGPRRGPKLFPPNMRGGAY